MATGDDDADPPGWPTGREALTYREARHVLDAQRETLSDIDPRLFGRFD